MNEYLNAQIEEHCQMVERGAKPLSFLPFQKRYYNEIIKIIQAHGLYYSTEFKEKEWVTIYFYKNEMIKYLIPDLPSKPKTPIDHMLIGLLLGYDINSICDYIFKKRKRC